MQTGMAEEQIQAVAVPSPERSAARMRELLEVHTEFINFLKVTEIKELQHFSKWGYEVTGLIVHASKEGETQWTQTWYIVDMDHKHELYYHLNMVVGPRGNTFYRTLWDEVASTPALARIDYEVSRATVNRLFTEILAGDGDIDWEDSLTDPHYGAKYLLVMRAEW